MTARGGERSKKEVLDALNDVVSVSPTPDKSTFAATAPPDAFYPASYSGQAPMRPSEPTPSVPTKDNYDPLASSHLPIPQPSNGGRIRTKEQPPPPPVAKGMSKFTGAFRRQTAEEKESKRREKEKRMNKAIDNSGIKNSRMDIIDRLDLSGVHGSSLFHHDSPYDACSPHSNRNHRRAPVMAFDHTIDPMTGQPIGTGVRQPTNRPGLSQLAAATMRKMDDSAGDLEDDGKGGDPAVYSTRAHQRRSQTMGQIPTLRMNSNTTSISNGSSHLNTPADTDDQVSLRSHSTVDRDVDAERSFRQEHYFNVPSNVSGGRADTANPNADIWGVSSEPWQDFAQPASARAGGLRPGMNGRGGAGRTSGESGGSGSASAASSVFDMEAVMTGKKATGSGSSSRRPVDETTPKRSKSLIKKFRTARQNPNVPPPAEEDVELGNLSISPDQGRMRAVSNNSSSSRRFQHAHSPSTPPLSSSAQGTQWVSKSDDAGLGRSGTLRARGSNSNVRNVSAGANSTDSNAPMTSPGLGRSGSIFGRFRGGKNRERGEVAAK